MATRLKATPEILARRRETVEHPFGTIKQWMNQGAFLMRGLDKVRAEFSLTALVYTGIDRGHDIAPLVTDLMKIGVADAAEENLELHVAFGRIAPWNRGGGQWRCRTGR
jgi:hypothetical protein